MKNDVKALKKRFEIPTSAKPGELLVTAEIYRVIEGFAIGSSRQFKAVRVWPPCEVCAPKECVHEVIKTLGYGQQGLMRLRKPRRKVRR